jgi:hypothetical protein
MITEGLPMARRKKQTRRRKDSRFNALSALEGLLFANILSQAAFNESAWNFLTAGTKLNPGTKWTGQGSQVLSLKELMNWSPARVGGSYAGMSGGEVIAKNLSENWLEAGFNSIILGAGFKIGSKMLAKPRRVVNKNLKMLSIPVKV